MIAIKCAYFYKFDPLYPCIHLASLLFYEVSEAKTYIRNSEPVQDVKSKIVEAGWVAKCSKDETFAITWRLVLL